MRMKRIRNRHKRLDGFQRLLLLLVFCLTIVLGTIIQTSPDNVNGLAGEVARLQKYSGVESPVTAVLLNFRGYDTLLEVMVLLLAVIGSWSLTKAPFSERNTGISPVQMGAVHLLAPLMLLVAAYLVWQGSHLAGGAFQGGAILGAAGVLILLSEPPEIRTISASPLRLGLAFGPLLFVGVALLCLVVTGELLNYPLRTASGFILLIEAACAISIGLTLASLFAGGRPEDEDREHYSSTDPAGNGDSP